MHTLTPGDTHRNDRSIKRTGSDNLWITLYLSRLLIMPLSVVGSYSVPFFCRTHIMNSWSSVSSSLGGIKWTRRHSFLLNRNSWISLIWEFVLLSVFLFFCICLYSAGVYGTLAKRVVFRVKDSGLLIGC